jgi:ADP-heptose:LPS heptosyltransferase
LTNGAKDEDVGLESLRGALGHGILRSVFVMSMVLAEALFALGGRRATARCATAGARRLLVVRLDDIGDVIMTTPFLRELRRNHPDAHISLVVKPSVLATVELCPYINEVLPYDGQLTRGLGQMSCAVRSIMFARKYLWHRRFDWAVNPRCDRDLYGAATLAFASGARWRAAWASSQRPRLASGARLVDRMTTHVVRNDAVTHEVQSNLFFLRSLGGRVEDERLEFWTGDHDRAFAADVLRRCRVTDKSLLVGISPSGGHNPLKRWRSERFAELADWIATEYAGRVMLFGSREDAAIGTEIEGMARFPLSNLIGRTTIRQAASLISHCDVVLACDAGLMHLATAMGVPVVGLLGPSCHHRFGPWGGVVVRPPDLKCGPCLQPIHADCCVICQHPDDRCMDRISTADVKAAMTSILNQAGVFSARAVPGGHTTAAAAARSCGGSA